jgi:protein-tyrosine phosphatase
MTARRFAILAVCHANLCRSPLVERLIRRALTAALGPAASSFDVSSAGTHARVGLAMHPYASTVLREWGADDAGFLSRRLDADAVARADLVLTADRPQRSICVTLVPAAAARAFTLREFGRLAAAVDPAALPGADPAARAVALVTEAHLARGWQQPVAPEDDDLGDPVGSPVEAFRDCARLIHSPVETTVGLLSPR